MRIYGFKITDIPADAFGKPDEDGLSSMLDGWEPAGWVEHCQEEFGEHREFFWPSERKMWRSRSSAQMRVDIVRRWGGDAILLEGQVSWTTVETANAQRKRRRNDARIQKLREQIREIETS